MNPLLNPFPLHTLLTCLRVHRHSYSIRRMLASSCFDLHLECSNFLWLLLFYLKQKKNKNQNQASRIIQDLNGMNCTVWTLWQAADLDNSLSPDGWGLVATSYCGYEGEVFFTRGTRVGDVTGPPQGLQHPISIISRSVASYTSVMLT